MSVIHLIRHGETDGNGSHYIGRRDLPLNGQGLVQAADLADRLHALPIGRILSSPLQRALQTVEPLARRRGLVVEVDAALVEFDFGVLQDLPKSERALNLRKSHALVPVEGGESLKLVWDRLRPFASRLLGALRPGEDVAVVGHYWSNRMLYGLLNGLRFEDALLIADYKPKNGSAVEIALPVIAV